MSYLVLARKYRPQTFADLVGQEQVSRTLQNALATGRVAHAYLFSGPRGVGKTTAARLLAMSLSCTAEKTADRPCGQCQNCLEIQSGQAVDVIEVDGASNRGINEIRDLRETVKYLPAKGRYKVYIIDEVHALTKDAFNALLKTLEEPPPHVVFIFATTESHKVLPTILSRCQRYDFRRIRVEDIVARLSHIMALENLAAEPEALEIIARQAEGGLRDSLSLLDQAIAAGGDGPITAEEVRRSLGLIDQALVRRAVLATLAGDAAEALGALDEAYLRGYDFKDLGGKLLEYIRGLTLVRVDRRNAQLMNLTETEEADFQREAAGHSLETLNRHFDAWLKFQRDLAFTPQPRWSLEAQVIRLAQTAPLIPVSELAERLGRLLSQGSAAGASSALPPRPSPSPATAAPGAPSSPSPSAPPAPPAPGARSQPSTAAPSSGGADRAAVSGYDQRPADNSGGGADGFHPGGEDEGPAGVVSSWKEFLAVFGSQLNEGLRGLLAKAKAESWNAQTVSLVLPPGDNLGRTVRSHLTAALTPLLQKALGGRPELALSQLEDRNLSAEGQAARLAALKETPAVQALMAELPGGFVEFQPEAPAPAPEDDDGEKTATETETNGEAPLEDSLEDPPEE